MNRETKPKRKLHVDNLQREPSVSITNNSGKEQKSKKKRTCPICRTTKFRATEDGLVCKYGHKALGFQIEVQDEFGRLGGSERKRIRKNIEDNVRIPPAKRRSDNMRVVQFALQVIGKCMVEDLHFPPELETTIRELWLFYISNAKKEIYEAYIFQANENKSKENNVKKVDALMKLEQEEEGLDSDVPYSESEEDDDEDEEDRVLKGKPLKKQKNKYAWPPQLSFNDTLAFIYLACTYLNYPILLNDLIRWSRDGIIPFLDIQHRIPSDIVSLDFNFTENMSAIPSRYRLAYRTYHYYVAFSKNCNLQFPTLNIPLHLERFCSQLYLPVQGYYYAEYLYTLYATKRTINSTPIVYHERYSATTIAMACVIVAAKIIYGVNGNQSDLQSASQYNTTLSKAEWLDKIRENLRRWKTVHKSNDDLDSIIQELRQVSYAYRNTAKDVDKQNMIVSLLGQIDVDIPPQRRAFPSKEHDLFMKSDDIAIDLTTKSEIPVHIKEGALYYRHVNKLRQQDYLDILDLGILIIGRSNRPVLEEVLRNIETRLFKAKHSKITLDEYTNAYQETKKLSSKNLQKISGTDKYGEKLSNNY